MVRILIYVDLGSSKVRPGERTAGVRIRQHRRLPTRILGATGTGACGSGSYRFCSQTPVPAAQFLLALIVHQ